jgi:hypothetical protein
LLQYSKVNELPGPETFNVESLHTWIQDHIRNTLNITGPGNDTWGDLTKMPKPKSLCHEFGSLLGSILWETKSEEENLDLVIPRKEADIDPLTRWVAGHGTPFWHNLKNAFKKTSTYKAVAPIWRLLCKPFKSRQNKDDKLPGGTLSKQRTHSNASTLSAFKRWMMFQQTAQPEKRKEEADEPPSLATYSMNAMIRFTNFVATVVACLFPIIAIVVLSKLHTQAQILGFIALFTAIFAIGIMILCDSGTSRTEVFTATAA